MRPEHWFACRELRWRKSWRASGCNYSVTRAGQVNNPCSGSQIWPDSAAPAPAIDQKIENCRSLRAAAVLLKKGAARRGGIQAQTIPVPNVICLDAEVIPQMHADE